MEADQKLFVKLDQSGQQQRPKTAKTSFCWMILLNQPHIWQYNEEGFYFFLNHSTKKATALECVDRLDYGSHDVSNDMARNWAQRSTTSCYFVKNIYP